MKDLRPKIDQVPLKLRGAVTKFVNEDQPVNINELMAWDRT
jgi:hypothetical protein